MIEWILGHVEPDFLEKPDIKIFSSLDLNIEAALRQYGFTGFDIMGTRGLSKSISDLWKLTEFALHFEIVENQDDPLVAMCQNAQVLDKICVNQASLFKEGVRLFPPSFPRSDDASHELLSNLQSLLDNYKNNYEEVKQGLQEKMESFTPSMQEGVSTQTLSELTEELKEFRDKLVSLKRESDGGLSDLIASRKLPESSNIALEGLIDEAHTQRTTLETLSSEIETSLSLIGDLQTTGLQSEVKELTSTMITGSQRSALQSQIKTL